MEFAKSAFLGVGRAIRCNSSPRSSAVGFPLLSLTRFGAKNGIYLGTLTRFGDKNGIYLQIENMKNKYESWLVLHSAAPNSKMMNV